MPPATRVPVSQRRRRPELPVPKSGTLKPERHRHCDRLVSFERFEPAGREQPISGFCRIIMIHRSRERAAEVRHELGADHWRPRNPSNWSATMLRWISAVPP